MARTVPLFYVREGDRVVVCNVNPGFERSNPWTLNLRAHPYARIQIGRGMAEVKARAATPQETDHYWPQLTQVWPAYQVFYDRGGKRSVFVLEPRDESGPLRLDGEASKPSSSASRLPGIHALDRSHTIGSSASQRVIRRAFATRDGKLVVRYSVTVSVVVGRWETRREPMATRDLRNTISPRGAAVLASTMTRGL